MTAAADSSGGQQRTVAVDGRGGHCAGSSRPLRILLEAEAEAEAEEAAVEVG